MAPSMSHRTEDDSRLPVNDDDLKGQDKAAVFIAKLREESPELLGPPTPEEERRVRRRTDFIVIPILAVAGCLSATDKVSVGMAVLFNMREDTNLSGQDYSWVNSMIYFGSISCVFLSTRIFQRFNAGKFYSTMILCWSIVMFGQSQANNYSQLLACRFLLGMSEAIVFTGPGLMLTSMYPKSEQPIRAAILYNTLSSIVNGLFSFAMGSTNGDYARWRLIFIFFGALTFVLSVIAFFFLPSSPLEAKFFSKRDKVVALERVKSNKTGVRNPDWKWNQAIEAFTDIKTYLLFLIIFLVNVPNTGLLSFSSLIVSSLGFTDKQTTLIGMPNGVFSWIGALFFSWAGAKCRQRALTLAVSIIPPFVGTIMLYTIPRTNKGASLAALYITYFYWSPFVICQSLLFCNTAGSTKKTMVYSISYIAYAVGNLVGPQAFLAKEAPKYTTGVSTMLGCYVAAFFISLFYYFYIRFLNARKRSYRRANNIPEPAVSGELPMKKPAEKKEPDSSERGEGQKDSDEKSGTNVYVDEHDFDDITDLKSPHFLYEY